ncbi:Crp/Fnr family transcriptional regulator [Bacillus sp. B1-b2]|uniref:Crp/Fnr family transcriptional regulator n=1 Tax=Bacillus sp. B1-b2 TaxID=2653201 RepID=UPI0012615A03|nr:Crp/Fnr family transcriptional regulator [Bacillus sp. B1-b2]KAB7668880.1 Crp/Fnr family transcriptional regulator [Bacillus sp. B1-b2]
MREIQNQGELDNYMENFQLDQVFPSQLKAHFHLYAFEQGESICRQGEKADYLYVLVEGKIKIYTTSAEGKTLILSFKTPLEMIGDIEFVRETEILNTVEAITDVVMIGVHKSFLHQYADKYPPFLQFLLQVITKKFYIKNASMSFNLLYPVEVRLASYLLSISFDEKDPLYNGDSKTMNLKDTANLIGTSYRHLNRVIQQFSLDGLIERRKGAIVVKNREGLTNLASRNIYE